MKTGNFARAVRVVLLVGLLGLTITGCGGGGGGDSVGVGNSSGPTGGNLPPTISGNPPTSVAQGASYAFAPAASDPDLDQLAFSIVNKPAWASFNASSGALTGTPGSGDTGTTSGIVISVSDGALSASLAPFSVTVTSGGSAVNVSNTQPQNYVWDTLAAGKAVYVDRNFVFQQVPSLLQGFDYLRTANDDKFESAPNSISFDVDRSVTVYVGYDVTVPTIPSWLQSWTNTGLVIDGSATDYRVYERNFGAGNVALGGNEMGFSMYTVAIASSSNPGGGNSAPTISGNAPSSVSEGVAYSFIPSANDPDGDSLSFSIANRPSWASFNTATGALTGTPGPGAVGTYSNISISVSDGMVSASLVPFNITVTSIANGSAALSWTAPTTNEDGSTLTDLAGYRLYWGTNLGNYPNSKSVSSGVTTDSVQNLANGTWFFVVTAYDTSGNESAFSNAASKTIQ